MTKQGAVCTAAIFLVMEATGLAEEPALRVCLTVSQALENAAPLKAALAEVNNIWRPLGVTVGRPEEFDNTCDRPILVKSDLEAGPEDAASETAIAWVPFVAGRARQVVFVRMGRALLIDAFSPGIRPPGLTQQLLAKLLARSLAHELGHVLLNSLDHERSGLMRKRYHAYDILRDLPCAYTLNARQRERLLARPASEARLGFR